MPQPFYYPPDEEIRTAEYRKPPRDRNFADAVRDFLGEGYGLAPPGVQDAGPRMDEETVDYVKGRRRADGSQVPPAPMKRPLLPIEPATDVDLREESGQGLPVGDDLGGQPYRIGSEDWPLGNEGSGKTLADAETAASEAYVARDSRRRRDPMAPRADDGLGEAAGYRGYEEYGSPGYGSQDNRPADEKAAGRERVQRSQHANVDELGFLNNPDGYTLEEQRLNAQVRSPDEQEQDRISEQDDAAELRRSQRKPMYDPDTGDLLDDKMRARAGYRIVDEFDANGKLTGKQRWRAANDVGEETLQRGDARKGLLRDQSGNVAVKMNDGSTKWVSDEELTNAPQNPKDRKWVGPDPGKQLGEYGQIGGTDYQKEERMARMAKRRGVPIETIAKELAAAEASGQVGANSAEAWKGTLRKNRDVINEEANNRKERFLNQVKMGRRSEAAWDASSEIADVGKRDAVRARMLGAPGADEGIAAGNVAAIKNLINQGIGKGGGDDDPKLRELKLQQAQALVDKERREGMTPAEIRVEKSRTATDPRGKAQAYVGDSQDAWNHGMQHIHHEDEARLRAKIEEDHPDATDPEKEAIYRHVVGQTGWLYNSG